jgi:hypothetical protein
VESPAPEARVVARYLELQAPDFEQVHLEKVASERIGDTIHGIWDAHGSRGERFWVITNPTNLYSQSDFPSMDICLSFHVGLVVRMMENRSLSVEEMEARAPILRAFRKLDSARTALHEARESEHFQTVGVLCREALLTLVDDLRGSVSGSSDTAGLKAGDFKGWSLAAARHFAEGIDRLEEYLVQSTRTTWDLAQRVTHSRRAKSFEAEILVDAVSNVLEVFATVTRKSQGPPECPRCGSYVLFEEYLPDTDAMSTLCLSCGYEVRRLALGRIQHEPPTSDPEGECVTVDAPLYPPIRERLP